MDKIQELGKEASEIRSKISGACIYVHFVCGKGSQLSSNSQRPLAEESLKEILYLQYYIVFIIMNSRNNNILFSLYLRLFYSVL